MIDFDVHHSLEGERVDRAIALLTGWSRADVGRLVGDGVVLVDGATVAKSHRLRSGEHVEVRGEPEPPGPPAPEPIDLGIRYEDDDVLVVAKPAGLVVHPSAGHPSGTLVNGLVARYPEIADVGDPGRPGIVHRLDRDTSGLLVVARSRRAHESLTTMIAAHEIDRRYVALVWGRFQEARGSVDAPVGRSTRRRTRMAVRDGGRSAVTHYEVEEQFDATSRLECRLETGRTHQIRVHLAAIEHPVVGDAAYGGARESIPLDRPFLHAVELAFAHPVTGEPVRVREPLPATLERVLADQRSKQR